MRKKIIPLLVACLLMASPVTGLVAKASGTAGTARITTEVPATHILTVTADNATVSYNDASGASLDVPRLDEFTLTIKAESGYEISRILLNGEDVTASLSGSSLTLSGINDRAELTVITNKKSAGSSSSSGGGSSDSDSTIDGSDSNDTTTDSSDSADGTAGSSTDGSGSTNITAGSNTGSINGSDTTAGSSRDSRGSTDITADSSTGGGNTSADAATGENTDENSEASGRITIPVSGDDATIYAEVIVNGNSANLGEIDLDELEQVIGSDVATGIVKVDLTVLDEPVSELTLSTAVVQEILEAAEHEENDTEALMIAFSSGTVTLDDKAMRTVVEQTVGSELRIVLEEIETADLNSVQQENVAGLDVYGVIDVYVMCVESGERISDFGGGTAKLSYTFVVPDGKRAEEFSAWHVADDGTLTRYDTVYENGALTWEVGHFSHYALAWEDSGTGTATAESAMNALLPWLILILVLCCGIWFVIWRRRKKDEEEEETKQ